jgi:hypothetical protein
VSLRSVAGEESPLSAIFGVRREGRIVHAVNDHGRDSRSLIW